MLLAAPVRRVDLPDADRRKLQQRGRDKGAPARQVKRARIVLLAAEGVPGQQIAALVGCAEGTVVTWRGRYAGHTLAAAGVAAGSGAQADADRAADPVRGDALVLPAAGRGAGRRGNADLARHHRPDLAPLRRTAVAGADGHVLHRSPVRNRDPRRRRAVPASAGARSGALRRREAADPGPAADRTHAAGATRAPRGGQLRLPPARLVVGAVAPFRSRGPPPHLYLVAPASLGCNPPLAWGVGWHVSTSNVRRLRGLRAVPRVLGCCSGAP